MITLRHVAGLVVGVALVAAAAGAAGSQSPQTSPSEQAAIVRGQALNVLYGVGKPDGMTHGAYRALAIRSAALNELYGIPVALTSEQVARMYGIGDVTSQVLGGLETPTPAPTPATPVAGPTNDGLDWADAAIGAAFVAGLALLGAASVRAFRHQVHLPHLRH